MRKPILLLLSVLSFAACNQKTKSSKESKTEAEVLKASLTTKLNDLLAPGYIKGFGVAIVNQDTTLYSKGFGYANTSEDVPYTANTLQNIASVSKTLIGVALLKAQEMGKLDINDPINDYLPFKVVNPAYPEEPITIKQLATHTGTIYDGDLYSEKSYIIESEGLYEKAKALQISEEFNSPEADMEMGDFLRNFLSKDGSWYLKTNYLENKPGERYEYSNVGATLAAYVLELATGQKYSDFSSQYILKPLGMAATGWTFSDIDPSEHTKLYSLSGEEIPFYHLVTYPDGGLITSVNDFSKYLRELILGFTGKGSLLSAESYRLLFSELLDENHFEERDVDNPYDDEYNSGVFLGHTPEGYIGHTGGDPGVSTFMFFDPDTKIGKLLFINTDLDPEGAKQFFSIWKQLEQYETQLEAAIRR
ncbi:beta-lactamase family protein [Flavobacteriaceae bacterium TP-CH-4]|uniref:Beta-lactamase family protein n=1 Tax=Pelagihabitans pacificus TaxID=2696054 RepID=A0A967E7Q3_9FLAO|nr:serine hydrolase domain-containing protein [Pelagihabitans pacificus]NHF60870.1 beta-lactamase family protein [Pelagihabitans pacificus]